MYKCKKKQKTVKILSSVTVHNVSLQHLLKKNIKYTFMPVVGRGLRCCCRGGGRNCTASAIMPHRHKMSALVIVAVGVCAPAVWK